MPFINKIDWIWIDTYDTFVLDVGDSRDFKNFCALVSPSRWRPKMINGYKRNVNNFNLQIEAVMIDKNEEFQF